MIGRAAAVSEIRTPMSATSQLVPVVPTFAPNTTPVPEETKGDRTDEPDGRHGRRAGRLHEERDDGTPDHAPQRGLSGLAEHRTER